MIIKIKDGEVAFAAAAVVLFLQVFCLSCLTRSFLFWFCYFFLSKFLMGNSKKYVTELGKSHKYVNDWGVDGLQSLCFCAVNEKNNLSGTSRAFKHCRSRQRRIFSTSVLLSTTASKLLCKLCFPQ